MASLSSLLADELGVSNDHAETLLTAMLREVRKQARHDRVHLPKLGTFWEEDGHLTFELHDGLARAVNEKYEGLEAEDLPLPPERTPRLDTTKKTAEEHRPLSEIQEDAEEEADASSGVDWPSAPNEDQPSSDSHTESDLTPSEFSPEPASLGADDQAESREILNSSQQKESSPQGEAKPASDSESSTVARLVIGAVVVLLLGGASWYLLGQRGIVPSPHSTFASLQPQSPPASEGPQEPSPPRRTTGSSNSTTQSTSDPGASSTATDTPADVPSSDDKPGSDPSPSAASRINPALGGWTLIVASRTEQGPAEDFEATCRERFSGTGLPVDVLVSQTDGTTRYRVAVGQFDSRSAAQAAIEKHQSRLTEGVWLLHLQ